MNCINGIPMEEFRVKAGKSKSKFIQPYMPEYDQIYLVF